MDILATILIALFVIASLVILFTSIWNFTLGFQITIIMLFIVWSVKPPIASFDIFPFLRINSTFLLLGWIINIFREKLFIPPSLSAKYYWFFIVTCYISAVISFEGIPIILRATTYIEPILFFYFALSVIYTYNNSKKIITPIIIGLVISILYGIYEVIFQENIFYSLNMLHLEESYLSDVRFLVSGRISLFIGQPVYAASLLLIFTPLILYYRNEVVSSKTGKRFFAIVIILSLVLIVFTGTRSAFVSFFVLLFTYLLVFSSSRIKIGFIVSVTLISIAVVMPPEFLEYLQNSFTLSSTESANVFQRYDLTQRLFDLFFEHPFFGFGPGFIQKIASSDLITRFRGLEGQENHYFMILADTGIFGLSFYLMYVTSVFKEIRNGIRLLDKKEHEFSKYLLVICIGLFFISVSVMMLNSPLMHLVMILLGINGAHIARINNTKQIIIIA